MFIEYIFIAIFLCILLLTILGFIFISFQKEEAEFVKELEEIEKEITINKRYKLK